MRKSGRLIPLLLIMALCIITLSGTALAYADPPAQEVTDVVTKPAEDTAEEGSECVGGGSPYDDPSLTPDGNMTFVDDICEVDILGEAPHVRQFITIQSKSGNYFYLIIDRADGKENVHFLNQVDEADLLALMDEESTAKPVSCSCTDKCAVGSINTACELCRVNMTECSGKDKPVTEDKPVESTPAEPEQQPAKNNAGTIFVVVLLAACAGGVLYFVRRSKAQTDTRGETDLDDYDYGQEDDERISTDDAFFPDDDSKD